MLHIPGIYNQILDQDEPSFRPWQFIIVFYNMTNVHHNTSINMWHLKIINVSHCNTGTFAIMIYAPFVNFSFSIKWYIAQFSRRYKSHEERHIWLAVYKDHNSFQQNMEGVDVRKKTAKYNLEFANKTSIKRLFINGNMKKVSITSGSFQTGWCCLI